MPTINYGTGTRNVSINDRWINIRITVAGAQGGNGGNDSAPGGTRGPGRKGTFSLPDSTPRTLTLRVGSQGGNGFGCVSNSGAGGGGSSSEVNDLSSIVTWDNIPDAFVPESAVTQHAVASRLLAEDTDWMALARGWDVEPTLNTTIAGGEVWNYHYDNGAGGVGYFRYIADDGSLDAFYSGFSDPTLSGFIVEKKIIL